MERVIGDDQVCPAAPPLATACSAEGKKKKKKKNKNNKRKKKPNQARKQAKSTADQKSCKRKGQKEFWRRKSIKIFACCLSYLLSLSVALSEELMKHVITIDKSLAQKMIPFISSMKL